MLVNIAQWRPEISIFNARLDAEHLKLKYHHSISPSLSARGDNLQSQILKSRGSEKNECLGVLKSLSHRYLLEGGAYYVSCQKRLYKMKYDFKGSIFKCQIWPALAKQPINV